MKKYILILLLISNLFGDSITAKLFENKPDGNSWDSKLLMLGDPNQVLPDIYFIINGISFRDTRCEDSYECTLDITDTDLKPPYNIEVWEADLSEDDFVGSFKKTYPEHKYRSQSVRIYIESFESAN